MDEQARHHARGREQATARATTDTGAQDKHRVGAGRQRQEERRGEEEA